MLLIGFDGSGDVAHWFEFGVVAVWITGFEWQWLMPLIGLVE